MFSSSPPGSEQIPTDHYGWFVKIPWFYPQKALKSKCKNLAAKWNCVAQPVDRTRQQNIMRHDHGTTPLTVHSFQTSALHERLPLRHWGKRDTTVLDMVGKLHRCTLRKCVLGAAWSPPRLFGWALLPLLQSSWTLPSSCVSSCEHPGCSSGERRRHTGHTCRASPLCAASRGP